MRNAFSYSVCIANANRTRAVRTLMALVRPTSTSGRSRSELTSPTEGVLASSLWLGDGGKVVMMII